MEGRGVKERVGDGRLAASRRLSVEELEGGLLYACYEICQYTSETKRDYLRYLNRDGLTVTLTQRGIFSEVTIFADGRQVLQGGRSVMSGAMYGSSANGTGWYASLGEVEKLKLLDGLRKRTDSVLEELKLRSGASKRNPLDGGRLVNVRRGAEARKQESRIEWDGGALSFDWEFDNQGE